MREQLENNHKNISTKNRAQLIDDAFELAEVGILSYDFPMQLIKYLPIKEHEYTPWAAALRSLDEVGHILETTKHYQNYRVRFSILNRMLSKKNWLYKNSLKTQQLKIR